MCMCFCAPKPTHLFLMCQTHIPLSPQRPVIYITKTASMTTQVLHGGLSRADQRVNSTKCPRFLDLFLTKLELKNVSRLIQHECAQTEKLDTGICSSRLCHVICCCQFLSLFSPESSRSPSASTRDELREIKLVNQNGTPQSYVVGLSGQGEGEGEGHTAASIRVFFFL